MSLEVVGEQKHSFQNVEMARATSKGGNCQYMANEWRRPVDGCYCDAIHLLQRFQSGKPIHGVPLTIAPGENVQCSKGRMWVTGKSRHHRVVAVSQAPPRSQGFSRRFLTFHFGICPAVSLCSIVSAPIPVLGDLEGPHK